MHEGCCAALTWGGGDLGGDGLSKLITEGLAGYPELVTEDGPGVVGVREGGVGATVVESEKIKNIAKFSQFIVHNN